MAKSAAARLGQLVFIKDNGDKTRKRDLYMVLEVDEGEDTAIICKVRNALSNKIASIEPQVSLQGQVGGDQTGPKPAEHHLALLPEQPGGRYDDYHH